MGLKLQTSNSGVDEVYLLPLSAGRGSAGSKKKAVTFITAFLKLLNLIL